MLCRWMSGAGLMSISWGSGLQSLKEGRGLGFALLHSAMKTTGSLLRPQNYTDKKNTPNPNLRQDQNQACTWDFPGNRASSSLCKLLEVTALSSVTRGSRKSVRQLACYLPDPISQCLHFCERVTPDKAQGMHSPCIQVQGGFSFFFFFLAPANVAMFDRSDLLSRNEPLGEKGQMHLPLATTLAAGRWTLLLCLGFNKCPSVYLSANVFPFHFQIGTNPVCRIRNFPSLTKVKGKKKPCKVQEEGREKNENKMNEQESVFALFS